MKQWPERDELVSTFETTWCRVQFWESRPGTGKKRHRKLDQLRTVVCQHIWVMGPAETQEELYPVS